MKFVLLVLVGHLLCLAVNQSELIVFTNNWLNTVYRDLPANSENNIGIEITNYGNVCFHNRNYEIKTLIYGVGYIHIGVIFILIISSPLSNRGFPVHLLSTRSQYSGGIRCFT